MKYGRIPENNKIKNQIFAIHNLLYDSDVIEIIEIRRNMVMATRQIRLKNDEILRKVCKPVKEIKQNTLTLLDDMADTMYAAEGVGLAAPQVGVLKRVVVIDIGEGLVELINPEIIETRGSQIDYEGCLSVPGESARVDRPEYVKVKAYNRKGEEIIVEGEELMAVALCHELDHLDGVLYIDKALPDEAEETE